MGSEPTPGQVHRYSLPGHDRECAEAMLSQARAGRPLDDVQVAHLLAIGARSAIRDAEARVLAEANPAVGGRSDGDVLRAETANVESGLPAEPQPGAYFELAVLRRFADGGPVDLATVRTQVAALLAELGRTYRQRDSLGRRIAVRYEELAKAREDMEYAEARGYARAVAALRDDELFRHWWTAKNVVAGREYWTSFGRNQLADFLDVIERMRPNAEGYLEVSDTTGGDPT